MKTILNEDNAVFFLVCESSVKVLSVACISCTPVIIM